MMSKPPIQSATAPPSRNGVPVTWFVTATQPPTGARPSTAPRNGWQSQVKRFRYG